MARTPEDIETAIGLTRADDFLRALSIFMEIYGTEDSPPLQGPKDARGVSFFGLCLALVQKKNKPAIALCKRAIDLEFYNGEHYANLARVYAAAGNRKKAVETADEGLRVAPENEYLRSVRKSFGIRKRPPIPILDRSNPLNVSLGIARKARKLTKTEERRKK